MSYFKAKTHQIQTPSWASKGGEGKGGSGGVPSTFFCNLRPWVKHM